MLTSATSTLSNNGASYSSERTGANETELNPDLASGGFFHADYKK